MLESVEKELSEKEKIFVKLEKEIERRLINYGWKDTTIFCPDELFEEVKKHFQSKGFKVWRYKNKKILVKKHS